MPDKQTPGGGLPPLGSIGPYKVRFEADTTALTVGVNIALDSIRTELHALQTSFSDFEASLANSLSHTINRLRIDLGQLTHDLHTAAASLRDVAGSGGYSPFYGDLGVGQVAAPRQHSGQPETPAAGSPPPVEASSPQSPTAHGPAGGQTTIPAGGSPPPSPSTGQHSLTGSLLDTLPNAAASGGYSPFYLDLGVGQVAAPRQQSGQSDTVAGGSPSQSTGHIPLSGSLADILRQFDPHTLNLAAGQHWPEMNPLQGLDPALRQTVLASHLTARQHLTQGADQKTLAQDAEALNHVADTLKTTFTKRFGEDTAQGQNLKALLGDAAKMDAIFGQSLSPAEIQRELSQRNPDLAANPTLLAEETLFQKAQRERQAKTTASTVREAQSLLENLSTTEQLLAETQSAIEHAPRRQRRSPGQTMRRGLGGIRCRRTVVQCRYLARRSVCPIGFLGILCQCVAAGHSL